MSPDIIYTALCNTCDILEQLSCRYFISGGTLLGARRDGDIIAHDVDFDIDCLAEDEKCILDAADLFMLRGLKIERKYIKSARNFETLELSSSPKYSSCLTVLYCGEHIGDISIYTIFDDGIARRFDFEDGVYSNPKMSLPCWYYSGDTFLELRGRAFRSVREPELVLEKTYGADWRTPMRPGEFTNTRTAQSGSVPDADIERMMIFAKEKGWIVSHPERPKWPQKIQWVGWPAEPGWEWIWRHEPMIRSDLREWIIDTNQCINLRGSADEDEVFLRKILAARAIQSEASRHKIHEIKKPTPKSFLRIIYELTPLPLRYKERAKKSLLCLLNILKSRKY